MRLAVCATTQTLTTKAAKAVAINAAAPTGIAGIETAVARPAIASRPASSSQLWRRNSRRPTSDAMIGAMAAMASPVSPSRLSARVKRQPRISRT
ncbi:hypothetical protein D3C72_1757760 [compost metagenome]